MKMYCSHVTVIACIGITTKMTMMMTMRTTILMMTITMMMMMVIMYWSHMTVGACIGIVAKGGGPKPGFWEGIYIQLEVYGPYGPDF